MINYLTFEQIIRLHDSMIDNFGGLKGVRDANLLLSSIESPMMAVFGEELYPTVYDKAAIYLFSIIRNHPFNDANKRTGAGAAYLFLQINKAPIPFNDESFENFVVKVAKGKITKEQIAHFLEYGKEIKKGP